MFIIEVIVDGAGVLECIIVCGVLIILPNLLAYIEGNKILGTLSNMLHSSTYASTTQYNLNNKHKV